jgi:DNA processing protein
VSACDACLRRTALLGLLASRIARALGSRRLPEVLALSEEDLIAALCRHKRAAVDGQLRAFDAAAARARAAAAGMQVVCRHAAAYPQALANAADAPAALHLIGDAGLLERTAHGAVAIVGSRRASPYGQEVAHSLGRELAACGVPIVSGMAYGIDSAAHEGALAAPGPTIAVMPGGADVASPSGKRPLYERIRAGGLVVAEMGPGARPWRWSFPARNRIMAALAQITIVVEGAESSGSLITAGFAQDLGRDVGAVPGQVTNTMAAGPNRLLSEGALVVRSAADVLDALYGAGRNGSGVRVARPRPAPATGLEPQLRALLDSVEGGVGTVDRLAADAPVADVLAGLSELEFLGLVRRGPGGDYVRRA